MRIISDELYAQLVKELQKDPKVALFQKLVLAEVVEPAEKPTTTETKGEEKA